MKQNLSAVLILLTFTTLTNAGITLSISSIRTLETDASITLSIDIRDTTSTPITINTADLAIAIGDGGSILGGSDPITIANLDFSAGVFGGNTDAIYGVPSPAFGNGAVVRGVQSTAGVELTNTPQTLATLTLNNLVAGDYGINLNAAGLTEIGQSGLGAVSTLSISDVANSRLIVSAVPEPSGFLFLGLVGLITAGNRWFRRYFS